MIKYSLMIKLSLFASINHTQYIKPSSQEIPIHQGDRIDDYSMNVINFGTNQLSLYKPELNERTITKKSFCLPSFSNM